MGPKALIRFKIQRNGKDGAVKYRTVAVGKGKAYEFLEPKAWRIHSKAERDVKVGIGLMWIGLSCKGMAFLNCPMACPKKN